MSETFWFRTLVVVLALIGVTMLYVATHPRNAVKIDEKTETLPNLDTPPVSR